MKNETSSTFSFSKSKIETYINYDLNLHQKFKESFKYLCSKMPVQTLVENLSTLDWYEGKNYNWAIISDESVTLIIRKYGKHFTIFTRSRIKFVDDDDDLYSYHVKYACFTFFSDLEKVENVSDYDDNDFKDLDELIKPLISFIKENKVYWLSNEYSFPREKHIEIKNVWDGGDSITSIDKFIFCCEELFQRHLELFAETDMLEKIKNFNIGDKVGVYEVTSIATKVKDNYYHAVGLHLKRGNEETFHDVYSLSTFYYDDIFNT